MAFVIPKDPIDYLVCLRYPLASKQALEKMSFSPETKEKMIRDAETYRNELLKKSPEEIEILHKQAEKRVEEERTKILEAKLPFFEKSSANADIIHWSKAAYWSLEEGVALLFGKNPKIVSWDKIRLYYTSPFVQNYEKVFDLVKRAKAMGNLLDFNLPGYFLAWAKDNEIPYPIALEQEVIKRGGQVANWKIRYEELQKEHTAALAQANKLIVSYKELATALENKINALNEQIDSMVQAQKEASEKPVLPRERDSLLKLVIGMAISGYKYNPKTLRNTATTEIAQDLSNAAIPLDPDTILKYLREAAELLPPDENSI